MDKETKDRIDEMCYEEMLRLWRNAPVGHYMFQGDTGDYFTQRMAEKRSEVRSAAHVAASKNIG